MKQWGFIGAAYADNSPNVACQRCVNLYPETVQVGGEKNVISLKSLPGMKPFSALPTESIRGMLSLNGHLWVVSGDTFYEVHADGGYNAIDTVLDDGFPCTLCGNGPTGHQILITSGGNVYCYDIVTLAFARAAFTSGPTDYVPGQFSAFLSERFIVLDVSSNVYYISDQYDGTTWDATNVVTNALYSDTWLSMIVSHGEIWLFGSQNAQVFRDVGTSPIPFAPIIGTSIQQGIFAPYSVTVWNNGIIWLGANVAGHGRVWYASAYQPQEVSTTAINQAIASYATSSDAIGSVELWNGHEFYVLNFPTEEKTWVLDAATSQWHERGWWDTTNGTYLAYRPGYHATAFGQQVVGDRESGNLYVLDANTFTDVDLAPLRRLRQCPHISAEEQWIFHSKLQVDAEVGLGVSSGQGSDPQIMLKWSDDGGHTWGSEQWRSLGPQGQYKRRALWRRLGRSRDRVYQVVVSDPIPVRFVDAYLDVQKGLS